MNGKEKISNAEQAIKGGLIIQRESLHSSSASDGLWRDRDWKKTANPSMDGGTVRLNL